MATPQIYQQNHNKKDFSMSTKQKAVDFSGFDERQQKNVGVYNSDDVDSPHAEQYSAVMPIERLGVGCKNMKEPVPTFRRAECEEILGKQNGKKYNTWIVLGRDRHGNVLTGYGGAGETQAGMIDIVVGRGGSKPSEAGQANPSFLGRHSDCARIYISQKAKIDQYFGLAAGKVGSAVGTSAIALKADDVRLLSRQGIKIVTGVDTHNSKDAELNSTYGIDLIAGNNDDDIQSLVKGENLVECLTRIIENLNALNSVVGQLSNVVGKMNRSLMAHTHPVPGPNTLPSPDYATAGITAGIKNLTSVKSSLTTARANTLGLEVNYLGIGGEGTQGSPKCILSRFNKTN